MGISLIISFFTLAELAHLVLIELTNLLLLIVLLTEALLFIVDLSHLEALHSVHLHEGGLEHSLVSLEAALNWALMLKVVHVVHLLDIGLAVPLSLVDALSLRSSLVGEKTRSIEGLSDQVEGSLWVD